VNSAEGAQRCVHDRSAGAAKGGEDEGAPDAGCAVIDDGGYRVNGSARPGRPARLAFGALGLVLLFGVGYGISALRFRRSPA
jgi:hypothetical protein